MGARMGTVPPNVTARLCRLREEHAVFRRRQFFTGTPAHDAVRDDLSPLTLNGRSLMLLRGTQR
jgi:hypothetical protein